MRVSGRTASGVAVGAVLLLAGCSGDGDDEPVTLPSATTSTATEEPTTSSTTSAQSAEPTPTTTLVLPDEHVESVDALITGLFQALNAAKTDGDFSGYDALYLPQCGGCSELRAELEGWLEGGQSVDGGDWTFVQLSSSQSPDGSLANFGVLLFRTEATISTADGAVVDVVAATDVLFGAGSVRPAAPWIVEDMGLTDA